MLDIKHLVTLQTIKRANSITGASKILNLTLSAISHQLQQLESYYECVLFVRKTNPLQFTAQGQLILNLADTILPLVHETSMQLKQQANNQPTHFNIALDCHSCYEWLMPTINQFRELHDLETDLIADFNFQSLEQLINNELDVVITGDPDFTLDICYTPLFDFEMMIGVSPRSVLAKKAYVFPEDLSDETIIVYPVDTSRLSIFSQFLTPANIFPKKIRTCQLTMMIVELTSYGRGISCLPNWAFAEFQKHSPIKTLKMGRQGIMGTLYFACRSENIQNPLLQDFIRLAKINSQERLKNITLY